MRLKIKPQPAKTNLQVPPPHPHHQQPLWPIIRHLTRYLLLPKMLQWSKSKLQLQTWSQSLCKIKAQLKLQILSLRVLEIIGFILTDGDQYFWYNKLFIYYNIQYSLLLFLNRFIDNLHILIPSISFKKYFLVNIWK